MPLFSKRHYEWLANWCGMEIKDAQGDVQLLKDRILAAHRLAIELQGTHPAYSRARFNEHVNEIVRGERVVLDLGHSLKQPKPRVPVIAPPPAVETCDGAFINSLRENGWKS